MYDFIIVGCGFAGTVMANLLAEDGNKVLILDKRKHIAGNMYDYVDNHGLLIHRYGPHILMLNDSSVYNYLTKYTEWLHLTTELETFVDGKFIPLPINFNSIKALYGYEKGLLIINELLEIYKENTAVNVMDLFESDSLIIKEFAKDIFDKVFIGYNKKMWGLMPSELDKNVIGRSPIKMSYNNEKGNYNFVVVPRLGYTKMFQRMLDNKNIVIELGINAKNILNIDKDTIYYKNEKFKGKIIYTGPIDELFDYKFGVLPYRAMYFRKEVKNVKEYYRTTAVTFPQNYKKTRTSEMKKITLQSNNRFTALVSEYPGEYNPTSIKFNNPSYPIINEVSINMLNKYKNELSKVSNLRIIGRLAEFQYFNMEDTILSAIRLYKELKGE